MNAGQDQFPSSVQGYFKTCSNPWLISCSCTNRTPKYMELSDPLNTMVGQKKPVHQRSPDCQFDRYGSLSRWVTLLPMAFLDKGEIMYCKLSAFWTQQLCFNPLSIFNPTTVILNEWVFFFFWTRWLIGRMNVYMQDTTQETANRLLVTFMHLHLLQHSLGAWNEPSMVPTDGKPKIKKNIK